MHFNQILCTIYFSKVLRNLLCFVFHVPFFKAGRNFLFDCLALDLECVLGLFRLFDSTLKCFFLHLDGVDLGVVNRTLCLLSLPVKASAFLVQYGSSDVWVESLDFSRYVELLLAFRHKFTCRDLLGVLLGEISEAVLVVAEVLVEAD